MIISHRHKFIFIHIPKTAGEAVSDALIPALGPEDLVLKTPPDIWRRSFFQPQHRRLGELSKHTRGRKVRSQIGEALWNDYFTFSFVREPIDRMLSWYRYLGSIAERRNQIHPKHLWLYLTAAGRASDPRRWPAMKVFQQTSSFSEFLRPPQGIEPRLLATQASYLCVERQGPVAVDYVGRFENIEDDFAEVTRHLGLGELPLPRRNTSGHSKPLAMRDDTVSDTDRSMLYERYARDYRLFGYPRTPPI